MNGRRIVGEIKKNKNGIGTRVAKQTPQSNHSKVPLFFFGGVDKNIKPKDLGSYLPLPTKQAD